MDGRPHQSSAEVDLVPCETLEQYFNRPRTCDRQRAEQDFGPEPIFEFDDEDHRITSERFVALPRARTNIEAVMGLFAAFLIGIPAPIAAMTGVFHLPGINRELSTVLGFFTLLATGYLCITVIRIGGRAVEGDRKGNSFYLSEASADVNRDEKGNREFFIPLALAMAIRLPNWWTPFRPFIAIWWLAHFVVAALIGHMVTRQLNGINNPDLVSILFRLAMTMAFLFAANLYLMLAIAVSILDTRVWLLAWRNRFVVDLVVTAGMLATA